MSRMPLFCLQTDINVRQVDDTTIEAGQNE